jgi:LPXTG-site transpeptidase (sortase) family protein
MKPYGYTYHKAIPIVVQSTPKPAHPAKRLLGPILITLGSIMVTNVLWPILEHQLISSPQLQKTEMVAPIPKERLYAVVSAPAVTQQSLQTSTVPQAMGADLDYSKVSNWFPEATQMSPEQPGSYIISIPSQNIYNAVVNIGGEDLDESLIHYAGTSLPGQLGSPVIFGHSILRQFYNPSEKNKDRYQSIFSKIMTMKTGDEIFVDYDGIKYTYEVKDKVEVKPEDLFILEQKYNNRELKLITCVPEGTYLRRGVIVAQLVDLK